MAQKADADGAVFLFVMCESQFNENTDSAELMIADYYNRKNEYMLNLITPDSLEVEEGCAFKIQIDATIGGERTQKNVVFASDNEDIATVSADGVINGISLGETVIKVAFHSEVNFINVSVVSAKSTFQDSVQINGVKTLRIGGAAKTYTAKFFDRHGRSLKDIATWAIINDGIADTPSFIEVIEKTSSTIRIRATGSVQNAGRSFILRVTGASGLVTDEIQINITTL